MAMRHRVQSENKGKQKIQENNIETMARPINTSRSKLAFK